MDNHSLSDDIHSGSYDLNGPLVSEDSLQSMMKEGDEEDESSSCDGDGDTDSNGWNQQANERTSLHSGGVLRKRNCDGQVESAPIFRTPSTEYDNNNNNNNEHSESYSDDGERPSSYRRGYQTSSKFHTNRRSSNQTDATPRFHNTGNTSPRPYPTELTLNEEEDLPPVPRHIGNVASSYHSRDRSMGSLEKSQSSLANVNSYNNSGAGFSIGAGDASVSSQSQVTNSIAPPSILLTPTSNMHSSYIRHTPEGSRHGHHVSMTGAVEPLPLTPDSKQSGASTMFTHTTGQQSTVQRRGRNPANRDHFTDLSNHAGHAPTHRDHLDNMSFQSIGSVTERLADESAPPMLDRRSKDTDAASTMDDSDLNEPIQCLGVLCPMWFTNFVRAAPSLHQIAYWIVHMLPCFWCCRRAPPGNAAERAVLTRLNVLCLLMALVQLGAAVTLAIFLLVLDEEPRVFKGFAPHFWNLNGAVWSVGILGLILIITCLCTTRVLKEVDLIGAIRYLWVLLWWVPFEIFFNITLFDYHRVTTVWIKHWWLEPQMSIFRDYFCEEGTENSKCLVPILGGEEFDSEDDWCQSFYNATDCLDIQEEAQSDMLGVVLQFYTGLAGWGTILLFLMLLMVDALERIISKPIVQKSRETNVPAWLSLPTLTNALVGLILLFSPSSLMSSSSGSDSSWIGILYLVASALFLIALITGWFLSAYTIKNQGDKKTKNLAVIILITVMVCAVLLLTAIVVASLLFSANLLETPVREGERGEVACVVDHGASCTNCDAEIPSNRCPEWTLDDVTTILRAQLKQSATLASIFILYAISVLRFGITLRKHLSMYQIDYV
eukprot:Nitzschia sp. Nitz4//scaffold35_size145790//96905//99466//NITZ4_003040-RA/size145790-augustus-gene-0.136-mRNA-1//-1//CDS//3329549154//2020//frame0